MVDSEEKTFNYAAKLYNIILVKDKGKIEAYRDDVKICESPCPNEIKSLILQQFD